MYIYRYHLLIYYTTILHYYSDTKSLLPPCISFCPTPTHVCDCFDDDDEEDESDDVVVVVPLKSCCCCSRCCLLEGGQANVVSGLPSLKSVSFSSRSSSGSDNVELPLAVILRPILSYFKQAPPRAAELFGPSDRI